MSKLEPATDRPGLVLIDGHALAYRAYHALGQAMSSPDGEPTSATYGFTAMLLQVLEQYAPEHLAVTFDRGRSGRDSLYPEYKANRAEAPADLAIQLTRIREIVAAFDIPIYELAGFEADDVIGTLARQAAEAGVETLIVTGDSDLLQLIEPGVRVAISGRRFTDSKVYDAAAVEARYGVRPEQLVEWKGLKGDSSDNIPGVPGIGEKTASELIQRFGSIEDAIAGAEAIAGRRVRENLLAHAEEARLSRRLSRIQRDLPLRLDLPATALRGYDREVVMRILRRLAFRSLVERLPAASDDPSAPAFEAPRPDGDYRLVTRLEDLRRLAQRLIGAERLAFDTETTGVDPMQAELVGLALTDTGGRGWYIPVGHRTALREAPTEPAHGAQLAMDFGADDVGGPPAAETTTEAATTTDSEAPPANLPLAAVLEALAPALAGPAVKYAHHAKYDLLVLRRHGLEVREPVFDTLIAAWLVEPGRRAIGLKDLAWSELGFEMTPIKALIGSGREQRSMAEVSVAEAGPYACADVDMTLRLAERLEPELEARRARQLFDTVEMPVAWVLADMEEAGIRVDPAVLAAISSDLAERAGELEARVHAAAGRPFNIASPKQLGELLFDELGLPATRRTKTGYGTSAGLLEDLRSEHPIVQDVLDWRHVQKLRGTYVDALPGMINPATGRIHTSWQQTSTVTGRLSSTDPNLQNIPVRTELGGQIRGAFVPRAGSVFLAADYSQMELRILASLSDDTSLRQVFEAGGDIHAATGGFLFDKDPSAVTSNERRIAKMVNFGVLYGMGAFGLSRRTGLSRGESADFIERYFDRYPGVRGYFDRVLTGAAEQGYVETILGRRRYFPQLQAGADSDHNTRQRAEREAINAPIQGSAADITKVAMIRLHAALRERGLGSRLLLQVHDELLLEVPQAELAELIPLTRSIMTGAVELPVPMVADLSVGPSWATLERVEA